MRDSRVALCLCFVALESVGNEEEDDDVSSSIVLTVPFLDRHNDDVDAVARFVPEEDHEDHVPAPPQVGLVPGGGLGQNDCWKYLSSKSGQHLAVQTKCMTCGVWVRHHRISEKVKAHLNRCKPFLSALCGGHDKKGASSVMLPDWIVLKAGGDGGNKKHGGATAKHIWQQCYYSKQHATGHEEEEGLYDACLLSHSTHERN